MKTIRVLLLLTGLSTSSIGLGADTSSISFKWVADVLAPDSKGDISNERPKKRKKLPQKYSVGAYQSAVFVRAEEMPKTLRAKISWLKADPDYKVSERSSKVIFKGIFEAVNNSEPSTLYHLLEGLDNLTSTTLLYPNSHSLVRTSLIDHFFDENKGILLFSVSKLNSTVVQCLIDEITKIDLKKSRDVINYRHKGKTALSSALEIAKSLKKNSFYKAKQMHEINLIIKYLEKVGATI